MRNKDKNITIRKISLLAMLLSMATVLKIASPMISDGANSSRLGIYEIPLIIAGFIGGPIYGFFVGFFTDGLYFIVKGGIYSILMALSTCLWGALSFLLIRKRSLKLSHLIIFVISISVIVFLINTLQMYIWYGAGIVAGFPIRLIIMVVKWPILVGTVWLLYHRVLPAFDLTDKNTFTK